MISKSTVGAYLQAFEIVFAIYITTTDLQFNRAVFGIDVMLHRRRVSLEQTRRCK